MRKIKLIWDFHGPDAKGIAEHHVIHLKEFATKGHLEVFEFGEEMLSEKHFTAYMAVQEKDMPLVRDTLRPHRGELFNE